MIVEGRPFTVGGEQRVAIAAVTTDANTDPDAEDVYSYGVDFNERSSSISSNDNARTENNGQGCGGGGDGVEEGRGLERRSLSWKASLEPAAVPCAVHADVAEKWVNAGAAEHASVASFARHSLQLMAVGAPAWLVQAAHEAAADEIKHAQLCFGLASKYLNASVTPGPLDVSGTNVILGDAAAAAAGGGGAADAGVSASIYVIESAIVEGCIGETIAAARAAISARAAVDDVVASVLSTIAADEARHAELGWSFVFWALSPQGLARLGLERDVAAAAVERAFKRGVAAAVARPVGGGSGGGSGSRPVPVPAPRTDGGGAGASRCTAESTAPPAPPSSSAAATALPSGSASMSSPPAALLLQHGVVAPEYAAAVSQWVNRTIFTPGVEDLLRDSLSPGLRRGGWQGKAHLLTLAAKGLEIILAKP